MNPAIRTRQRTAQAQPTSGSQTITSTASEQGPFINVPPSGILHLRGQHTPAQSEADDSASRSDTAPERRVQWTEDTVNNEGMGKKKSKVCCIYHKPREVGESSDEDSSSSSDSDSDGGDSGADDGSARPSARGVRRDAARGHDHDHNHDHQHRRRHSPNAYEKQPKSAVKRTSQEISTPQPT